MRISVAVVGLLALLTGCGPLDDWVMDMKNKCFAMKGRGVHIRATHTFECWRDPPSLRLSLNHDPKYAPHPTLLFREVYAPPAK
jgi:hypothetical protein